MKKTTGKRFALCFLAAALCLCACAPASASAGNRILLHASEEDGAEFSHIETVFRTDDGFCVICYSEGTRYLLRYADSFSEPERFVFEEEGEEEYIPAAYKAETADFPEEEPEEDEEDPDDGFLLSGGPRAGETYDGTGTDGGEYYDISRETAAWFSRGNEIFALEYTDASGETGSRIDSVSARRVRLADGTAKTEDCGLPELDAAYLVSDWGGYQSFNGCESVFCAGDRLVVTNYDNSVKKLLIFDLEDGSCRDTEPGDSAEIIPGPDGSILAVRYEGRPGNMKAVVSKLDPAGGKEQRMAEISGVDESGVSPCYDDENHILYYLNKGQLWKMPDGKQAEAVSECYEHDCGAVLLPDGCILLWNNENVTAVSTDPAQDSGVTLRVYNNTGMDNILAKAVYEMGRARGDVSVDLRQDMNVNNNDILTSMLKHDAYTDIYVKQYDTGDFRALRNRDYLADLGSNQQIAEMTGRLYPWLQDAVKRDGKIIAVPVALYGASVNINPHAWHMLGGTEEELPRTWEQFFDWLGSLPERLEGTDAAVTGGYTSVRDFRSQLLNCLLTAYQVRLDSTDGEYTFNTPLLRNLVKRACETDYRALGIPDTEEYVEGEALLSFGNFSGIGSIGTNVPLALALEEGETPYVPVSLAAVFVNPYSEHPEEAKEFLAVILKSLDPYQQYSLFADRTEPVKNPNGGDPEAAEERVSEIRKEYEAAEGEEKVTLEEVLRIAEENLQDILDDRWRISPEDIAQYRTSQAAFRVLDHLFLRDLVGTGGDAEALEAYELLFYGNGTTDAEKALEAVDKKLRMKNLEGN